MRGSKWLVQRPEPAKLVILAAGQLQHQQEQVKDIEEDARGESH